MIELMDFEPNAEPYSAPIGPVIPDPMDCMRCGICLSQCPTYQLTQEEQEGPRQRVRTLSQLLNDSQNVDLQALQHLQNCLQCRACEVICPSKMDYGKLFDQAQKNGLLPTKLNTYATIALHLVAHKQVLHLLLPLVKFYQLSGLRALLRKGQILERIGLSRADKISPVPILSSLKSIYRVNNTKRGTVALFTGCVAEHFDQATLLSAIKVLNKLGYEVLVPKQQSCCGALHFHNGEQQSAQLLMRNNLKVFTALDVDAIIYCATGCGCQLQAYQNLLKIEEAGQQNAFQEKLFEITQFVEQHWQTELKLQPCPNKVMIHEPCSQRNVLKTQQSQYQLLSRIPELEVTELADKHLCCGAGGSYMLTHPDNADALSALKWQSMQNNAVDYLLTANIGCALHLANSDSAQQSIEIIHPISLLAKQLDG